MRNVQIRIWTRDDILRLLATSDDAVKRAIVALYHRQTEDEKVDQNTKVHNGQGFNSRDARFLTSVAQALPRYNNNITPKQLAVARKMLPKYWRQLLEVAEEKGASVDYKRAKAEPKPARVPELQL